MEFGSYISCIKIKGVPILPPLITPERRKELEAYRNQALLLEDLYNNRKLTRKKDEECSKNVEPANELQCHELNLDKVLKDIKTPLKYVPYVTEKKVLNLSKELVDVSEYSSATGISKCSIVSEIETTTTSGIELETSDEEIRKTSESSSDAITEMEKPRLIRSNSYTLDNPSPLLLAHLERQKSDSSSSDNTVTDSHLIENERISADMLNVFMDNNGSSHSNNEIEDSNEVNESIVFPFINQEHQKTKNNPPIVEVVTTDITVQQINITTSIDNNLQKEDIIEIINNNDSRNEAVSDLNKNTDTDPMNELKLVLQQIPEMYSKKIVELIEKQNQEQSKRIENYETLKQFLLQCGEGENNKIEVPTPKEIFVKQNVPENMSLERMKSFSEEKFKNSVSIGSQPLIYDDTESFTESLADDSLKFIKTNRNSKEIKKTSKFPERKTEEEKAARIICAYAKGYLVRRLMKTAKVVQLIQTIQEALICALKMRASDFLEEADIELHRRLIQQISAACYEFHDVFFALTIPEQMNLIAVDREQKKKALKIKTIRSDFKSHKRRSSGVRLTKSLTSM